MLTPMVPKVSLLFNILECVYYIVILFDMSDYSTWLSIGVRFYLK